MCISARIRRGSGHVPAEAGRGLGGSGEICAGAVVQCHTPLTDLGESVKRFGGSLLANRRDESDVLNLHPLLSLPCRFLAVNFFLETRICSFAQSMDNIVAWRRNHFGTVRCDRFERRSRLISSSKSDVSLLAGTFVRAVRLSL